LKKGDVVGCGYFSKLLMVNENAENQEEKKIFFIAYIRFLNFRK